MVVIIKSLKVPKIKKMLLYEMKFIVPNYCCLQNLRLGSCRPQIPVLSVLCPQLNLLNPPPPSPPNKIPGYATGNQYIFTVFCTYLWGPCFLVGAQNTSLVSILSRISFIFSSYPSPNSTRHCSSIENVACSVDLRWVAFPVFGWFLRHGHCLSASQRLAWNRNKVDKMCINHGIALVNRNDANMSCSDTSVSIRKAVCSRDLLYFLTANTESSKKMDGIWNRYNLKSTGRIYTFGVLKCS